MALETVGARLTLKERRQFSADAAKAKRDIKELGDEAEKTGKKAERASGGTGYTGGFGLLSKALGLVTRVAKPVLFALGGIGVAAVAMGVKTRASMEQAEIGFTTMLGSGERAKSFMADLRAFAEKTPFQLPDVVTGAQRLLAYGFAADKILPTLTSIGDATAALGLGAEGIDRVVTAIGQIKAKGAVQAEEMRQLAEAGIPAWDILAKKLGVDIPTAMALVEKRSVSSTVGIAALTEGINSRFGGLMEKQSHSIAGIWSNIVDSVRNGLADMVLPFEDDLKRAEKAVLGFSQRVFKKFPEIAGRVRAQAPGIFSALQNLDAAGVAGGLDAILGTGGRLVPILTQIIQAGMDLWVLFRDGIGPAFAAAGSLIPLGTLALAADLLHFLATNAEDLQPLIVGLIVAWVAFRTVMGAANTVIRINSALFGANGVVTTLARAKVILFGEAAAGATTSTWGLNAALLANPIGLIVLAVVALIAVFVLLYFHVERFRRGVDKAWGALQDAFGWIVDRVTSLPGDLAAAAVGLWDWIPRGARAAANLAVSALNEVIDRLNSFEIHISAPGLTIAGRDVIPDWSYDWNGLQIPHVSDFARGGLALATPGGTIGRIAEAGHNELVLPIPLPGEVSPISAQFERALSAAGNQRGSNDGPRVVQVVLDRRVIAEATIDGFGDKKARR